MEGGSAVSHQVSRYAPNLIESVYQEANGGNVNPLQFSILYPGYYFFA